MAQANLDNNEEQEPEEEEPLLPNQLCVATMDFEAQEELDLAFQAGDHIRIVEPCELLFWYIGKNSEGKTGMVPRNFLQPAQEDSREEPENQPTPAPPHPPPRPPVPSYHGNRGKADDIGEDYLPMGPSASRIPPGGHLLTSKPPPLPHNSPIDSAHQLVREREKKRRFPPGTLVMGTCPFLGEQEGDLPFNVYEEMTLLSPLKDLCWYQAQKADSPEEKGSIPITHVRLVYMSDDEDEDGTCKEDTKAGHERLYDDINEFISQSGWFSYPGLAHGKPALQHVLAKKANLSYEVFMGIQSATYLLKYRQAEKVFVGKAKLLHEELCTHFQCFDKKREEMREIDDELCHHTDASGWELKVWPLEPGQEIEVEWAKKIVEHDALVQSTETEEVEERGHGQNEELVFTSINNFDSFWEWFSPN